PHKAREPMPLGQRYRHGTMTVETRWSGLTVTDTLQGDEPDTVLLRVLSGSVPVRLSFAPRPEFGRVPTQLEPVGDELRVIGSNDPMTLVAPGVTWSVVSDGGHHTAHAVVDLAEAGGTVTIELRLGGEVGGAPTGNGVADVLLRQTEAEREWRDWSRSLRLPGRARDLVLRSALTLRALWYQPTGAIIAAGTSSLPEEMGGVRNWDYRYCWLRDAAMSAQSLVLLGSGEEAESLLAWTRRIIE